ncbi:helix-turn-helix domain-containing protein [Micromonospora viridifaciens]|uniref:helix-turn-helix transcriptional regulator n=1 Tax=Micromonospora viridifaciens TaxID=1881 RepID=UPI0012FD63A7|nr:helix-turn-helix transcriptional regulator [Micromonospora viridifaciens]
MPQLLDVSPEEAAAAVDGLAAKGLLTRVEGRPAHLIVSPPDIAGEVLVSRRKQELHTAHAALRRLADEYRTAWPDQLRTLVEPTPDAAVRQRIDQIQRMARREVMIFDVPPYASPEAASGAAGNETEFERLAAGVRYRTVYDRRAVEQEGAMLRVARYVEAGEEARMAHRVPLKLMIVDSELAIVPTVAGEAGQSAGSALIHPSPLLDGLIELFEQVWAHALPLSPGGVAQPERPPLSAPDRQLLTLLLGGLTDTVIARQLGVGQRTVLRRVRGLMDRAGAVTRMQLAWYAAQHGWIEPTTPERPQTTSTPDDGD